MSRRLLSALVTGAAVVLLAACGATADSATDDSATENTGSAAAATTVAPSAPDSRTGLPVPLPAPAPGDKPAVPPVVPPAGGAPQVPGTVPPGLTELGADRLDTRGLPAQYRQRRAWVSPDGRTLTVIAVATDSCAGVDGRADESVATSVRVLLAPMATPQGGPVDGPICAQVLTEKVVTVALVAPLGTRTVVVETAR